MTREADAHAQGVLGLKAESQLQLARWYLNNGGEQESWLRLKPDDRNEGSNSLVVFNQTNVAMVFLMFAGAHNRARVHRWTRNSSTNFNVQ